MVASPCGRVKATITGMSDPTTHTSCWRMPNRAKARPWADNGIMRCVNASNDGWATAPAIPTMNASTTWANSVPQTATPSAEAPMRQREASSNCCSVIRLRSRPTRTRPTMAPAPLPASTRPYQ